MKALLLHATPEKISTRVDRSLVITLATQELSPEEYAELFKLHQLPVQCLLKNAEIEPDDIDNIDYTPSPDDFKKHKTPSQRLRNTIYRYWEQVETKEEFNDYYARTMEKIISNIKDKIQ